MNKKIIIILTVILMLNFLFISQVTASNDESNNDDKGHWYDGFLEFIENITSYLTDIKGKVQNIENNLVKWIADALLEFPLSLGQTLIDMIVNPLAATVPQFLLETIDIENVTILNTIWKACYGIGIVILTLLTAVGLGFGGNEAFKYDNFGTPEHILVRMFFTLGLMTASKQIAVVIYDIAGWMAQYVFSETALAISTSWNVGGTTGMLKLVLFGIFLLPAILLNIVIYVILIIRILDIMMLTALSPISASTFVLPNTKSVALNHFKEYISVVLVQFILIVFLALWTGLATFMDGLMLQFTGNFALDGLAQVVGQGIMMIVLTVYTLTRPGWLKRMLGVGSSGSIGGLLQLAKMFF